MSDTDATQARQDVVADVDEILEHVINANMLSMPYDVYIELFDAVDGLGAGIENIQSQNAKLRELVRQMHTCLTRPKVYAGASSPYLIATGCPYFTQGVCDYNSCGFEQRMRELGVES